MVEVVARETAGAMVDVVVDVSGSTQAIKTSVECVRRQGTMVLAGLTGDSTVTRMMMDKLVWGEIRGTLYPGRGRGDPRAISDQSAY